MTRRELALRIKIQEARAKVLVMQQAPVKTGNLMRSIKTEKTNDGFRVYVDEGQAPYMPYTEKPWTSSKWGGRKNPNQGWFEDAAAIVARSTAAALKSKSS